MYIIEQMTLVLIKSHREFQMSEKMGTEPIVLVTELWWPSLSRHLTTDETLASTVEKSENVYFLYF